VIRGRSLSLLCMVRGRPTCQGVAGEAEDGPVAYRDRAGFAAKANGVLVPVQN
jgi:hypothetical protein